MLSLLAGQYPHLAKMYFELKSGNDMRLSHDNSPEEEQKKCDAFQSTSYIEGEVTLGNPFRFLSKAPQNGRIALGHALLESHRSKSRVIASTETTAFKGKIGSMSSELGRINV